MVQYKLLRTFHESQLMNLRRWLFGRSASFIGKSWLKISALKPYTLSFILVFLSLILEAAIVDELLKHR
jgi:hypothetical protein